MEPALRNAIARIDIMQGDQSTSRGTGFLVGPGLVLTALHVVADRGQETLQLYAGQIRLTFPGHQTTARAVPELWDRFADWILLTCDDPQPAAAPLPMADLRISGGSWSTFGFPDANPRDGMEQSGTVESHQAPFERVTAYQLFSKQAAAGDGAPSKGLSGAPVIMQGAVVGLLRFALMKGAQTVGGTLYGCAIRDVIDRCGALLPPLIDPIVVPEDLSFRDLDRLRQACGVVHGKGVRASGYLIDGSRVITSARVAESVGLGAAITIDWPGADTAEQTTATVARIDSAANCAVLLASVAPAHATPLALADCPNGRVLWQGYGFPVAGGDESLPISGVVREIGTRPGAILKLAFDQDSQGGLDNFDGLPGSPVMVNGRVIGQITDKLLRPLAAATATRDVRTLLTGDDPRASGPDDPLPSAPGEPPGPPSPQTGPRDVAVSYAAADTVWARQLADRLTALGLHPFMDMLPPADASKDARERALAGSAAGVIVLSQAFLDALVLPAFQQGAAAAGPLRANPAARVVMARVDVCDPPADWRSTTLIDFTDRRTPDGPRLVEMYAALAGDLGASVGHPDMESRVTDHLLRDARAAVRAARAAGDPRTLLALHQQWQTAGVIDPAVTCLIAESLIQLNHPDHALALLDGLDGVAARGDQLRALALSKLGRIDESITILTGLGDSGQLDAETGGLLGGRYKQKWLDTGNARFLTSAKEVYLETFERTGDSYPGINAAALALQLNQRDESVRLATRVTDVLGRLPVGALDHWQLATLAEAHLLSGDLPLASTWYGRAVAAETMAIENIAAMRRQARVNLAALGQPAGALDDVLAVPSVAVFSGHMVDAVGRETPRFPANKVGKVRLAIRARLAHRRTEIGFASAAGGSDLLFLEELLSRGGRAHVFLPFPKPDFMRISVGPDWAGRFERVLEHPRVEVTVIAAVCPPSAEQPAAFAACNGELQRAAMAFAKRLDEAPVLLSVSAGTADGAGGTLDAIRAWEDEGLEVDPIDLSTL